MKKYRFSEGYLNRFESNLKGSSLAFQFKKSVSGTFVLAVEESLLPHYCELALVEAALAKLEQHPENIRLLEVLGKYTKNNFSTIAGYWIHKLLGVGLLLTSVAALVCLTFLFNMLSTPLIIVFASVLTLKIYLTIAPFSSAYLLAPKCGQWLWDSIKGKNWKPLNLDEIRENLKELIEIDLVAERGLVEQSAISSYENRRENENQASYLNDTINFSPNSSDLTVYSNHDQSRQFWMSSIQPGVVPLKFTFFGSDRFSEGAMSLEAVIPESMARWLASGLGSRLWDLCQEDSLLSNSSQFPLDNEAQKSLTHK